MHNIWKCTFLVMLLACGTRSSFRIPTKVTFTCCESVSPNRFSHTVTGYKQQIAQGPCVHAIIFETDKGQICSSPGARWVQKKMKEVPMIP
ncbi:hypothetical protein COCON_G00090100 [Conger conger]|uniref:Chemokine interleukin-8-like domain-containing protein n=1 Tax=Conger conger TaxID=82655 RepID=A0A9Q1I0U2_CONCO|nr:hypothetical protein COCON_G00090100 [Conger conger]